MVMGTVPVEHIHHFVPRLAGKGAQVLQCACGERPASETHGSVVAATGAKVFFRRRNWYGEVTSGKAPLWHRLVDITAGTDRRGYWMSSWEALCGYQLKMNAIDPNPTQRDDVLTARLRCKKCDAKFERNA